MNKDVIYIEPEDDITDILANIKGAKNKIIALVPPKKAGVLHSAVNFKLIAKTAAKNEKTVVLITSDESLLRLADITKMPTAKSLQSKPHLPTMDDAEEFGEEGSDDDAPEEDVKEEESDSKETEKKEDEEVEEKGKKTAKKAAVAAAAKKKSDIDMEIDGDKEDAEENDDKKKSSKKKIHIPNFKKFRWPLIIGIFLLAAIISFSYWASNVAPAAKITVKVKAISSNFNETVTFVTDQTKSDPAKGIFFAEQKTIVKQATDDFEATGEVDKGTKASGNITVTRPKGDVVSENDLNFSIPANTTVTINGKQYIVSEGGSANAKESDVEQCGGSVFKPKICLSRDITSGKITVVAKEVGDSYNIAAATSGITLGISTSKKYSIVSSDMTGGTSKIVKVVSAEDVDKASLGITSDIDSEAREELSRQFSADYILIASSFATESSKITTSPAVNEEVGEGVTPKIIKENKYVIYAVNKNEVNDYIKTVVSAKLGDNTQIVYSTGVAMNEDEDNKAFFESFKNENSNLSAKLKSTAKTGPRITEEQVREDSRGKKIGLAQSKLRSYNGVSEVKIDTSYFWVTSIPTDDNKVEIEITVE